LSYQIYSRHYKGFGIHSPFVFYLVRELFWDSHFYYSFDKIDAARNMLLRNRQKINVSTLGVSSVTSGKQKSIRKLVKEGSLPDKYGKLLFRLLNKMAPETIIELGTGTGMGTLYLALPCSKARVVSIDGNGELHEIAKNLFDVAEVSNVELRNGSFQQHLPEILNRVEQVDFVLFDGDHRYESTLEYFDFCLKKAHNDSVFVFDDIHWSPEMEKVWNEIISRPEITVSIDLFRIGIVFFRKECTKHHYRVRY
jgi:predicted O-methyltransferase YrrM